MTRAPSWTLPAFAAALLVGCGGAATPGDIAAQACDAQVRTQMAGKPYALDLSALAGRMEDDGRGGTLLKAKIIVNAGLADEDEQDLECTVRMAADGSSAEVLTVRFIW